jgi:hypothetical protein
MALEIVEDKYQRCWHIYTMLPSGAPLDVIGFKNESAAKAWIRSETARSLREVLRGNSPQNPDPAQRGTLSLPGGRFHPDEKLP